MEQKVTILEGYSDEEKGAYLGAIASLATADRSASEEELEYIEALIESANISAEKSDLIMNAANSQVSDNDLKGFLDILKSSELRYSLVSDVIAFAQADETYSEEEKQNVAQIAQYLGVNQEQYAVLNQFTNTAVQEVPKQAEQLEAEQTNPNNFLSSLGFGDKLKNAGINSNSLFKGALGIIGPMLLAKIFSGGRRRSAGMGSGSRGGGLLGGLLGGGSGSGGGLLGGLLGGGGGGLLGGLLGGGRGFVVQVECWDASLEADAKILKYILKKE